jgi:hypothetical protein
MSSKFSRLFQKARAITLTCSFACVGEYLRKIALQEADSLIYFYYLPGVVERWIKVGARKKGDSETDMKTTLEGRDFITTQE